MKHLKKWSLFVSLFQLIVGVIAIAAFVVLALAGESMGRWIVTLLLAIAMVAMGVMGLWEAFRK